MSDSVELLFFDTFAHENTEEVNLDLVQFPKPVYVTEVRIIPLGARVQADFPGGVRLGATNPSQFKIEFFVNDLGKPGASAFETIGGFEYNQNGCINLLCIGDETVRKIPTDGLVLRGWYTTITLAVYGILTDKITEQIVPPVSQTLSQPGPTSEIQVITQNNVKGEWPEAIPPVNADYIAPQPAPAYPQPYVQPEVYAPGAQEYSGDFYNDSLKDPRSYHHTPEAEWDSKPRDRSLEKDKARERESYQKIDDHEPRSRDRRRYSRSQSRDRKDYRESSRDKDWDSDHKDRDRDRDRERDRDRDRERDRDRDRERDRYGHRRYTDREERKRPRTPPIHSPKRPHTPFVVEKSSPIKDEPPSPQQPHKEDDAKEAQKIDDKNAEDSMDVEEFEPILSDEDIVDDSEAFQDLDYDYSDYTNNDDLMKLFTPGTSLLCNYDQESWYTFENNVLVVDEYLKNTILIVDDFFKSSIAQYTVDSFEKLNAEIKEEFIHLAERATQMFNDTKTFCTVIKIKEEVKVEHEIVSKIEYITEALVNWLMIALNFDLANAQDQPVYKIRHIKCGIKLAEWCCESTGFVRLLWERNYYIHDQLLQLYEREYMALSIKLMILKALDNYLLKKETVEVFLMGIKMQEKQNGYHDLVPVEERNGYRVIVEMIDQNPSVRVKFALNSILKKLNIFDLLHKLKLLVTKKCNSDDVTFTDEQSHFIAQSLEFILQSLQSGIFVLSQPKRFLPVISQFEINRSPETTKDPLIELFKMQNLLQVLLILITNNSTFNNVNIKYIIYEILEELSTRKFGLKYLYENPECTNLLVKILMQSSEEEVQAYLSDALNSHNLGLKIAYKVQTMYLIDILNDKKYECDNGNVIDTLHALFCLTFTNIGKLATVEVLGMGKNLKCLLHYIKPESLLKPNVGKSPAIGYIIDLIHLVISVVPNVPLLEKYSKFLLDVFGNQELSEEFSRVLEIVPFLKPFEQFLLQDTYNIKALVEDISTNASNITTNPSTLISQLRILEHQGISKNVNKYLINENPLNNFTELKYKHVILQLYTFDGVLIFSHLLQELCDYYEQPHVHSSVFASNVGIGIVNVTSPCVILIKQMLTYVIQCRNTQFKDLTCVPILLRTYNLCQNFPTSSLGYPVARNICNEIIETLLVYTQPISEEIHEKDSLNKSLWTLMCAEVIKYTLMAPYTFVAGLSVFSEILPLPLPMQSLEEMNEAEISWAINLRKLWSAHLHYHSSMIQDLIGKLCSTSNQTLMNLLRKVCAQISDLAGNSAMMIARGILDNVHSAIVVSDEVVKMVCNGHIARLMNFLACLVTHNSLKVSVLHLLSNSSRAKGDEKYGAIISAFGQILKSTSNVASHVATQECILSIFQCFCDTEITLHANSTGDCYLSNALPTKEYLVVFLNTMLDHLNTDNSFMTYLPVLRTLLLLTEHNYGFYHLRECLLRERKQPPFNLLLTKLEQNFSKDSDDCLRTLNTLKEFIRVCTMPEEVGNDFSLPFPPRTMKMSIMEIRSVIGWFEESRQNHVLVKLEDKLKEFVAEEDSLERLLESLQSTIALLDEKTVGENEYSEPILPIPEPLLTQFAERVIFSTNDALDERLRSSQYPAAISEENEGEAENITCDLSEICRQDLTGDLNLIKQVEKLCRVCVSERPDAKEKDKRSAQKDKTKRPFVSSMRGRGFARSLQIRSDLFRSRPPNTSRPPSLHVDDFVALETCGAQPTGPTGYNKISREFLATNRVSRGTRGRSFAISDRSSHYRQLSWWGPSLGRPY